jgi:hypothetical protein
MSPNRYRGYLNVPFAEKDQAKELGARWDPRVRKWYIPENSDLDPYAFAKWHAISEEKGGLRITGPIFLAESITLCWKCKGAAPVIALATEDYQSDGHPYIVFLDSIRELPPRLVAILSERFEFFRKDNSRTAGMAYFMNHCHCGARLGDFYLKEEPGSAFLPITPEGGARITLRQLPIGTPIFLKYANYSSSTANFVAPYAKREQF